MFRRRGEGVGGGGGRAKLQYLNTSAVPSQGNLTKNFAPCCRDYFEFNHAEDWVLNLCSRRHHLGKYQ